MKKKFILGIFTLLFFPSVALASDLRDKIAPSDGIGEITQFTKSYNTTDDYTTINAKITLTETNLQQVLNQAPGSSASPGTFYLTLNVNFGLQGAQTYYKENNFFTTEDFATAKAVVDEKIDEEKTALNGSNTPNVWPFGLMVLYYDSATASFKKLDLPFDGSKSIATLLVEKLNLGSANELEYGTNYKLSMYTTYYWLYGWELPDESREYVKMTYEVNFPVNATDSNGVVTNYFTLSSALEANETNIDINSPIIESEDITIPAGTTVTISDTGSLTIGADNTLTNNGTFEASYIQDGKEYYSVTVAPIQNGRVTVDKSFATTGEKVRITIVPAEGYVLRENSLKANSGQIDITNNEFTIEDKNVIITAEFEIENPNTLDPIVTSLIIFSISLIGIWLSASFLKKKLNEV